MSSSSRDYHADNSSTDEDDVQRMYMGGRPGRRREDIHGWTRWRCNLNNKLIHVMAARDNLLRQRTVSSLLGGNGRLLHTITEPEMYMERNLSDFVLNRAVEDQRVDGGRLILHPEAFLSFGIPRARLHGEGENDFRRNSDEMSGRTTPSSDDEFLHKSKRHVTYDDQTLVRVK